MPGLLQLNTYFSHSAVLTAVLHCWSSAHTSHAVWFCSHRLGPFFRLIQSVHIVPACFCQFYPLSSSLFAPLLWCYKLFFLLLYFALRFPISLTYILTAFSFLPVCLLMWKLSWRFPSQKSKWKVSPVSLVQLQTTVNREGINHSREEQHFSPDFSSLGREEFEDTLFRLVPVLPVPSDWSVIQPQSNYFTQNSWLGLFSYDGLIQHRLRCQDEIPPLVTKNKASKHSVTDLHVVWLFTFRSSWSVQTAAERTWWYFLNNAGGQSAEGEGWSKRSTQLSNIQLCKHIQSERERHIDQAMRQHPNHCVIPATTIKSSVWSHERGFCRLDPQTAASLGLTEKSFVLRIEWRVLLSVSLG